MGILTTAARRLGLVVRSGTAAEIPEAIRPPARQPVSDPMSLDAVFRAVQILQSAASQLTLDVWRGADPIPAPGWTVNPNPWQPGTTFIDETISSLALNGNAFWKVTRADTTAADIVALDVLDPTEVTIRVPDQPTGPRIFQWAGQTFTGRDMCHLALIRQPGKRHPYGLGPIQACRATVEGAAKLRAWADDWIDNSTIPNGMLTTDMDLSAEDAADARRQFLSRVSAREPMVFGKGVHYEPLILKPEDMQWLEAQRFNVTAIARLFGIPARLMLASVEGGAQTYQNQAQEELSFVRWTLMSYLREIESAVSWLLPRGQTARFNLDAILRADTKSRYQSHQIALAAGFKTVNEVRADEGLPISDEATANTLQPAAAHSEEEANA